MSSRSRKILEIALGRTESVQDSDLEETESLFDGDYSDVDPTYTPEDSLCYKKLRNVEIYPEILDSISNNGDTPSHHYSSINSDINEIQTLFDWDLSDVSTYMPEESKLVTSKNLTNTEEDPATIVAPLLFDILANVWKAVKPRRRWRCTNTANWKRNIAKKRRAEGLPYESANKKLKSAKVTKFVDCSRCKFKCSLKFSENHRSLLCRHYWSLDYVMQKNFILANIVVKTPKRVLVERKRNTQRSNTKEYYFMQNNEKTQICQSFFCKTLCIAPSVITNAVDNRSDLGVYKLKSDPRGHKEPPNKTPSEKICEVRRHIESFPTMESHYTRKDTKRQYLDASLSIKKMCCLYIEKCKENNTKPVSEITYRRTFSREYNLSFFVPKKDQCLLCTRYKRNDVDSKIKLKYDAHIARKNSCNKAKEMDKEKAEKEKSFLSATFDLQAVLQIPSTDVGLLYYSRKLTIYNLTLYESAIPNEGYCFAWSEIHGKKGSCEIGTVLFYYLLNCVPEHVTEISLFSDTCGGQNRNQFVSAILLWAVQNIEHIQSIEQKFLESGHTYMEADSMHSSIESAKKFSSVYSINEWLNIFKMARSKGKYKSGQKVVEKKPFHVKEFKYHEFKDLKNLAEKIIINRTVDTEGNTVNWLKIKRMRYVKGDLKMHFNYDLGDDNLKTIDFSGATLQYENRYSTRRKKQPERDFPRELKNLYPEPLRISVAKKKDLINLCNTGVIPEEYHAWYKQLLSRTDVVDYIPDEPADDSLEEDE